MKRKGKEKAIGHNSAEGLYKVVWRRTRTLTIHD